MSNSEQETQDRLEAVFARVRMTARVFYSGCLCGTVDIPTGSGSGHLHLLKAGRLLVQPKEGQQMELVGPAAMLLPRPHVHRLTPADGSADLVCAEINLGGVLNPLEVGLPDFLPVRLSEEDTLRGALAILFSEAQTVEFGRQLVLDRLAEIAVIYVIRRALDSPERHVGLLGGLAHPALAKALTRIHAAPAQHWTLERMAEEAGLSRSVFAVTFREVVGQTPGDYLQLLRLQMARAALASGKPLKQVAGEVGYDSYGALSRALSQRFGVGPRQTSRRDKAQ